VSTVKNIGMVGSLAELRKEGFVPFTHGPLYVYGGVPFDIIERFAMETLTECYTTNYDFQEFEIITLPKPYNVRLFVMDDTSYPKFCAWLDTVEIVREEHKLFAVPRRVAAPITDPFMRYVNVSVPKPELIDVWTVSSMTESIKPKTHTEVLLYPVFREGEAEDLAREEFLKRLPKPASAPLKIELQRDKPDPTVIVRGRARYKEMGD